VARPHRLGIFITIRAFSSAPTRNALRCIPDAYAYARDEDNLLVTPVLIRRADLTFGHFDVSAFREWSTLRPRHVRGRPKRQGYLSLGGIRRNFNVISRADFRCRAETQLAAGSDGKQTLPRQRTGRAIASRDQAISSSLSRAFIRFEGSRMKGGQASSL